MLKLEAIGNLGSDAQIMRNQNGKEFCAFNIATSRKYKKSTGEEIKETTWISVSVNWNCSNILPYLHKGTKVFVSGMMRTRIFTSKQGIPCVSIELIADNLELCSTQTQETENNDETYSI